MSRKRIFTCDRCVQHFSGRVAFDYHMNAHRRTDPPKRKVIAPRQPRVYTVSGGNDSADTEGAT